MTSTATPWWESTEMDGRAVLVRACLPGDGLHGFEPLSGLMVANDAAEALMIDAALAAAKTGGA